MPLISTVGMMNPIGFGFSAINPSVIVLGSNPTYIYQWDNNNNGFGSKLSNAPAASTDLFFSPKKNYLGTVDSSSATPTISNWVNGSGVKTTYTGTATGGAIRGSCISGAQTTAIYGVGLSGSPLDTYPFSSTGFGTKQTSITVTSTTGYAPIYKAVTTNTGYIIMGGNVAANYIMAFSHTNGSAVSTKLTAPATLPSDHVNYGDVFGDVVAFGCASDIVAVYNFVISFGTKVTNPSGLPAATQGYKAAFSRDGKYISITCNASPFVLVYPWSGSAFGTKVTNPSFIMSSIFSIPSGVWSSKGNAFAFAGQNTSPYVWVFPFSSGTFGTKLSDPTTLPTSAIGPIAFN